MRPMPAPRCTAPHRRTVALGLAVVLVVGGLAGCEPPTLTARAVVTGRAHIWEIAFTPAGTMLWTERGGRIMKRTTGGTVTQVRADMSGLFVAGETGLMGLAVDPAFASNRRIYTCQG